MMYVVLQKNELILSLCFPRRFSLINEIAVPTDTFISSHFSHFRLCRKQVSIDFQ